MFSKGPIGGVPPLNSLAILLRYRFSSYNGSGISPHEEGSFSGIILGGGPFLGEFSGVRSGRTLCCGACRLFGEFSGVRGGRTLYCGACRLSILPWDGVSTRSSPRVNSSGCSMSCFSSIIDSLLILKSSILLRVTIEREMLSLKGALDSKYLDFPDIFLPTGLETSLSQTRTIDLFLVTFFLKNWAVFLGLVTSVSVFLGEFLKMLCLWIFLVIGDFLKGYSDSFCEWFLNYPAVLKLPGICLSLKLFRGLFSNFVLGIDASLKFSLLLSLLILCI